jgi:hypothetical protein
MGGVTPMIDIRDIARHFFSGTTFNATKISALFIVGSTFAASAQTNSMKMAMPEKPAHFAATRQAYTTNHDFLVKLVSVPNPIPFDFRLA